MQRLVEFKVTLPGETEPVTCRMTKRVVDLLGVHEVTRMFRKNLPKVVLRVGDIIPGGECVGFSKLLEEKEKRATFPDHLPEAKCSKTITILMDSIPQENGGGLVAFTLEKCRDYAFLRTRVVQKVEGGRILDCRTFSPHEHVMC